MFKKLLLVTLILTFSNIAIAEENNMTTKSAIFAGGCFWCMEKPFDKLDGVISTTSGYAGGHVDNPTYEQVSSGKSGHVEVMKVVYDPEKIDYKTLLHTLWRNIDPFDNDGQFCDKGEQYRSAIFYNDEEEKKLAEESKAEIAELFGEEVYTDIREVAPFYEAEDYHQDYYQNNPIRYKFFRAGCGRDSRLKVLWGDK